MHFLLTLSIFHCLFAALFGQQPPSPTQAYPNKAILKAPDSVILYWRADSTDIIFEIQYKNVPAQPSTMPNVVSQNTSWILFGIVNPNADKSTLRADAIVAWVDTKGFGHFSDRYMSTQQSTSVVLDQQTNAFPLAAFVSGAYTTIKFTRKINICQTVQPQEDLDIPSGQVKLLFATGSQYTMDENIYLPNGIANLDSSTQTLISTPAMSCSLVPTPAPRVFNSQPTSTYVNMIELVPDTFRFYWNYTQTELIGEIHVKTTSWVGFGLSPNGGMDGSDVFIGLISSNGTTNFTDRHISHTNILMDKTQDWKLLSSRLANGISMFKFSRKLVTCDPDDRNIEAGSPYVIYAWGDNSTATQSYYSGAANDFVTYHGHMNRGSKVVPLINKVTKQIDAVNDLETVDFNINNMLVPNVSTTYYCKMFQVPKSLSDAKRHILKWEISLPAINFKSMHHVLLYECNADYKGTPTIQDGDCFDPNRSSSQCQKISLGWAVGGDTVSIFPKDTGYPIGGGSDYSHFVIEVHYDNPQMAQGYIDKLALRYYMTKSLRHNELGVLTFGAASSMMGIAIPPGEPRFEVTNYCTKGCTKKIASSGINVISALPHTHMTGIEVSTRIVRNGVDIGNLFENKYYDFNYQNEYYFNTPVVLKPGDEFITKCIYNTNDRYKMTFGGTSTQEEMCMQMFMYYPRSSGIRDCWTLISKDDWITLIKDLNRTNVIKLANSSNEYLSSYQPIIDTYTQIKDLSNIDTNMRQQFRKLFTDSTVQEICEMDFTSDAPMKRLVPTQNLATVDACSAIASNATMINPQLTPFQMEIWSILAKVKDLIQTILNMYGNNYNQF